MAIADLLVIGGGIHGACVARDAARRGLSVILLEKGDLAEGTSHRSSKLVHGGLRYLETGQFALVKEALAERTAWLRIAPHLVRPQPFLLPFVRGEGRSSWWIGLGLGLYDAFAGDASLPKHKRIGRDEARTLEPALAGVDLSGAAFFWDAAMDDAALVVACAMDAVAAGAVVKTRADVVALERASAKGGSDRWWRAMFAEGSSAAGRRVVNATGASVDVLRKLGGVGKVPSIRPTRGAHVVVPALTGEHALLFFARRDGRVFFVIPSGGRSLVGTTDTDHDGLPEAVAPTAEDIAYLWSEIAERWPERADTLATDTSRVFAGLRPLVRAKKDRPWDNPREARVLEERGMFTIVGGKYTTARRLAERVVDQVAKQIGATVKKCDTATASLPDPRGPGAASANADAAPTREAIEHAVRHAFAQGAGDVIWRRSGLWRDRAAARAAAGPVAATMAELLSWDDARREAEVRAVHDECDAEDRVIAEAREIFAGLASRV